MARTRRAPEEIADAEYEQVLERVCAIDVAKQFGQVCVRIPRADGKRASTVTCNDFHTWMRLQPGRQSHGTGIGKQLKRPIRAEIDQDGFEV